MRLINVKTFKLEEFLDYKTPHYAILSHTWGDDCEELTFRNVEKGEIDKPGVGSVKFRGCCRQAEADGLGYAWIDTCCINKDSSRELDEAINSMFRWYSCAAVCYVYLSDVPGGDNSRKQGSKFRTSRWFKRGWTLQELLAPKHVRFYNLEWHCLETKAKLCSTVEKITGVPRQFLLGTAELRAASVAQRMSWAAQRDTKRKEDLAYCLLGIFDVSMPMIYGEGGDKAFSRLQKEIMRTTRDHSILAWNLSEKGPPPGDSAKATDGRILAATPSDFARSGHIVPREQLNASPNSLDISGGSLRAHLSLLTTSAGEIIGLLSCGPEHDRQQIVGIPLARMLSGSSDEYVRPRGCHSVLQPITASRASAKLVHIMIDSETKKATETNQQHWSCDDDGFAEVNLNLVEVVPRSCWDEERALIMSTIKSDGAMCQTLVRFRHVVKEGSRDFVIVLEFEQQDTGLEPQCCVMTCCRSMPLEELAGNLQHVAQKAYRKRSASNGLLNLCVTVERVGQQSMSIIKPEAMPHPPDVTIDATVELQKLELLLEVERILEENCRDNAEEEELDQQAKGKGNRLDRIKRERETVEGELRKLEEKRRTLAEAESNEAQEMDHLRERQAEVKKRQEQASKLWLSVRKRWDGLCHTDGGEDGYELERMGDQTPLRWAAENGHIEMVKLLLDKGADVAVADKDGWTPLIAASSEGQADVVRLLLATSRVNADLKDSECGQTPLSWAAASGREAVVQLLLDTGKVDINSKDNNGRTPLQWAAEMGHEAVVQLLSSTAARATVRLWDTKTGVHQQMLKGHSDYVCGVVFSPDGTMLASASADKTVWLWDAKTGAHQQTLSHSGYVFGVAFSPDGATLASAGGAAVRLWDAKTGAHQQMLEGYSSDVNGVAFSPDGTMFASASSNGTIRLWDAKTGAHQRTLKGHSGIVNGVAFSPDGTTLASASDDTTVRLWDAKMGAHQRMLKGHSGSVCGVAFSPDGTTLASASSDGTVWLWDAKTGAHQQTLKGHSGSIFGVAFSPDGTMLASASSDGTVRLWDAKMWAHQQTLEGHSGSVYGIAFSPDGMTLASASYDRTVRLWRRKL